MERFRSSRTVSTKSSITHNKDTSLVAKKKRSYSMKTKDDLISTWITGMAITNDGRILVVDRESILPKDETAIITQTARRRLG